jgi:glycyl-tRNA synthetase beta chain
MAEFFLELFSEEIPARMQAGAASLLEGLLTQGLAAVKPKLVKLYYGPRRIAIALDIGAEIPAQVSSERGPRVSAPEAALNGFLRKHGAARTDVVQEGEFWVLNKSLPGQAAAEFLAGALPELLGKLSWPKSMRWGTSGDFTWVRPLRRIVALLDGVVIPFTFGPVTSGNETEGHRVHGPGPFEVSSAAVWEEKLREHHVVADAGERRAKIWADLTDLAEAKGLVLAVDEALLDEVTGLVEWPVALLGGIDAAFMDLPYEVRELSMKINQKYFAVRHQDGTPAPYFGFAANLEATDGGAAIIAGNERVLRARLSDARHFWDLDLKMPLEALLPKLEKITFHAKIGTQRQRAERIAKLAGEIAAKLGGDVAVKAAASRAGLLCKADLVTGMVGEFPELQGIMGGYYATRSDGALVGNAIRTHYQPKGPSDDVPTGLVAVSVALADKQDTLREFFRVGEKPTGSGDPFALRRAALGVIRIIIENGLRLPLSNVIGDVPDLFGFIAERLRVKLRGEGRRFDVLDAVLAAGADDDLYRIDKKVAALEEILATEDGKNLLAAYKRAANILKIEDAKDGPHISEPVVGPLPEKAEEEFRDGLEFVIRETLPAFEAENYALAIAGLAKLRSLVDAFFEKVTVNAPEPELRRNRLRLSARFRDTVNKIADFARIEG